MTTTNRKTTWRDRVKKRRVAQAARREHGESVRQLWADSAAALPKFEAKREGTARVPQRLQVVRPGAQVLIEVGPSQRAWYRQKERDARATAKKARRTRETRDERNLRLAVPQPSRRQRILAAREVQP